jgi:hypothetical protein
MGWISYACESRRGSLSEWQAVVFSDTIPSSERDYCQLLQYRRRTQSLVSEPCQKCKQARPGRLCDYDDQGDCSERNAERRRAHFAYHHGKILTTPATPPSESGVREHASSSFATSPTLELTG